MNKLATQVGLGIVFSGILFFGTNQSAKAGFTIPPEPPETNPVPESSATNTLIGLGALGMGLALKQKLASRSEDK